MVPLTCTSALVWRRLPLISTSTWSGPRPRSVAGRTESVPSVIVGRGKLNDGASAWMIWMVSLAPAVAICCGVRMSTGTAFSAAAPAAREPTVISSEKPNASAKSRARGVARQDELADCGLETREGDPDLDVLALRQRRRHGYRVAAVGPGQRH